MTKGQGVDLSGLLPPVKDSLNRLDELVRQRGGNLRVNSAYRSLAKQAQLYANRANNPYPVAPPGHSEHGRGTALDLGVSGMSQGELAQLAQQVHLKWAGARDPVHFSYDGELSQTNGKNTNLFQAALDRRQKSQAEQQAQAQRWNYVLGDQSQQGSPEDDAKWGQFLNPQPDQQGGFLGSVNNWWNEVAHGQGPQGQPLDFVDRAKAAISPIGSGIDYALGGFIPALHGGLLTGLGRVYGGVKGGVLNYLGQGVRNVADMAEGQPPEPVDFSQVAQRAQAGFNGRGRGLASELFTPGAPNFDQQLQGHPVEQQLLKLADFLTDWEAFPEAMKPLAPVFRVAGQGVRIGTDLTANALDTLAERTQQTAPGFSKFVNRFNNAPMLGFKNLTGATPELRQFEQYRKNNLEEYGAARQALDRVKNTARNLTQKMEGTPGATPYGDFLSYHPDPEIAAQAGGNVGSLAEQALLHGAEAGSEGSFFNHKDEVLAIAADKGIPVKPLSQAIDEFKTISEVGGQRMVDQDLMDPEVFKENAGYWVRRFYRTNVQDAAQREALIKDMIARGISDTRANNIVMHLQAAGESGPEGTVGSGLKTAGNTAKQYQRKLETPEDRMAFQPNYNALDAASRSILSQFKAAGIAGSLRDLAGNQALSAANEIKNLPLATGGPLKFVDTPRLKNMLSDTTEQIKAHQAYLDDRLEKQYNGQQKWVSDQQQTLERLQAEMAEHASREPKKPLGPLLPQRTNAPVTAGELPLTQEVEPGVRRAETGAAVYQPNLRGILEQIKGGHRVVGKSTGEALPHGQLVKDVQEITREENVPGGTVPAGVSVKRPDVKGILQNIKESAEKLQYDQASRQFVEDLQKWQDQHQGWQQRMDRLSQRMQETQGELARRQQYLDATEQAVGQWFDEAERIQRRADLLRGANPTDEHANDALSQVEEKLGFQIADPAERQKWFDAWKNAWRTRTIDIFDPRNVTPPVAPQGIPDELVRRVDQNIIPAVALDSTLSADGNVYSSNNHPPGWELWDGKGNRDYGAMEGRWGPSIIRHLVEDAIDPNRYVKNGLANPALKFFNLLTREYKALRLYYNPSTRLGIFIQSFWNAKATANAEGVGFDPRAYLDGMREYKQVIEGEKPIGDSTLAQGLMRSGAEMGTGYGSGVDPGEIAAVGPESAFRRFANNSQRKFVETHQFPKAGLVNVLIKAGKDPVEAARIADMAIGGRGNLGGIETHGVQQIAETANRYGLAIFTSYPLHSINRFFQLMAQKPEVFAPYPVIRNYLMQAAGGQAQQKDALGQVEKQMVPIPGMKDAQGNPVWLDASNLIPYEGALRDNPFGIGAPSIISKLLPALTGAGSDTLNRQGAGPDTSMNEAIRQAYFAIAPNVIGRNADTLARSLGGQTQTPYAVNAPTPLMALGAFAGLPMRWEENATDRFLGKEQKAVLPGRQQFYELYLNRLENDKETPTDYSGHLKGMDFRSLKMAQSASRRYLNGLLSDRSVDEGTARTMIRRQIDYVVSINKTLQEQANVVTAQLAAQGDTDEGQ